MAVDALRQAGAADLARWLVKSLCALLLAAMPIIALAQTPDLPDLAYGPEPRQRMDVYLPAMTERTPVLLMVHGGAWVVGDKSMPRVVEQKVAHWVRDRGFILVSVNYRLAPEVHPPTQAADIARALAMVQRRAPSWGGDPSRVVLMGHSAGAHLVALLSARPELAVAQGAARWRGTVALDGAALDTVALMQRPHLRLYDRAFGADPAVWRSASPTAQLAPGALPMLLVCSSQRRDDPCAQSRTFAGAVAASGGRAEVLPQDLSHAQINAELGLPGAYTAAVDAFIASLGLPP